ncbi:hypothetical protein [Flaviaesturariibacter aridisoli]|uniref:Uncharacterized protein n=1 Tax=Flaviaesturariibacter aridisoli TaxID=2545761 RepID=A0A4R4E544_9BACT|nr:hypothetical protein [Flaviaesturariibacter aridisoli]TCZ74746.1 hypothetical protein E0486_00130 [Flaviaesturariibacter aridisoli]
MANRISPDPTQAGHFEWQHPGLPPVSLRYNELLHSMRVQTGDERRVYLLESSPAHTRKVALFNEYGLRCGSCSFDDTRPLRGSLRWEDRKFRFRQEGDQLVLSGPDGPLASDWPLAPEASLEAIAGVLLMMARQKSSGPSAPPAAGGR